MLNCHHVTPLESTGQFPLFQRHRKETVSLGFGFVDDPMSYGSQLLSMGGWEYIVVMIASGQLDRLIYTTDGLPPILMEYRNNGQLLTRYRNYDNYGQSCELKIVSRQDVVHSSLSCFQFCGENTWKNCLYVQPQRDSQQLVAVDRTTFEMTPTNIPNGVEQIVAQTDVDLIGIRNGKICRLNTTIDDSCTPMKLYSPNLYHYCRVRLLSDSILLCDKQVFPKETYSSLLLFRYCFVDRELSQEISTIGLYDQRRYCHPCIVFDENTLAVGTRQRLLLFDRRNPRTAMGSLEDPRFNNRTHELTRKLNSNQVVLAGPITENKWDLYTIDIRKGCGASKCPKRFSEIRGLLVTPNNQIVVVEQAQQKKFNCYLEDI